MRQPQVSQIETGPPIRDLDALTYWARTLRIPPGLLWFRLPAETGELAVTEPAVDQFGTTLGRRQFNGAQPGWDTSGEHLDEHDPEHDPVLAAPWNHRGTVEAVVVLSGGDRVKRRVFLSLAGPALTAPAHQWLVHEPEPVVSGLAGRRVSAGVVDRLPAMIAELRTMEGHHCPRGAETHREARRARDQDQLGTRQTLLTP